MNDPGDKNFGSNRSSSGGHEKILHSSVTKTRLYPEGERGKTPMNEYRATRRTSMGENDQLTTSYEIAFTTFN